MLQQNRKKKWIIIAIAVVVIIALVVGAFSLFTAEPANEQATGTLDKVKRRDIAISITGSGRVETATKEDITGGSYGSLVKSVAVKVGDMVKAGDVICVFDTEDYEDRLEDVKQQIVDAEENRKTQNADYDKQIAERKETIANNLSKAETNLKNANTTLEKEKTELAKREKALKDYLAISGNSEMDVQAVNLQSAIDSQKVTVDNAQSRVDNYQAQVDNYKEQDASSLEDAKENYNDGVDAQIENYEEQIENYETLIEDATIHASISGVVTSLNVKANGQFNGGTIASIEATKDFIIEAQIDEYDIADVKVGMKVLVKTDATRTKEMMGVVSYVAPRATDSGSSALGGLSGLMGSDMSSITSTNKGNATYLIKVELDEDDERLRLGMNAKISVVTEESVNALSVPYDAVFTREDGSTYVSVVTGKDEDGNPITKETDVKIGIQGTYYVEVISDKIKEGTQIYIPAAKGNSSIRDLLNMMGADAGI